MTACPSSFSLERLLVAESEQAWVIAQHVRQCARCTSRLEDMKRTAAAFARSSHASPARLGFEQADRRWKHRAAAVVATPLIVVGLVALSLVRAPSQDTGLAVAGPARVAEQPSVAAPSVGAVETAHQEREGAPVVQIAEAPRQTRPAKTRNTAPASPPPDVATRVPRKDDQDDFAMAFGSPSERAVPAEPRKHEVYIPPAAGAQERETLSQSDIMEVVFANKGALSRCAEEQHKREPGVTGKLLMRWAISRAGRTSEVRVASAEFKDTYMATCVGGVIKGMTFPRSRTAPEPVTFPFKF